MKEDTDNSKPAPSNFIKNIIEEDRSKNLDKKVQTRFPPEPNGYLHIGHAKSIFLNFSLAEIYGGTCNLRFDDSNPAKEEQEYVDSILKDLDWLGIDVKDKALYASDYFDQMYEFALKLIEKGKAYVCSLSPDELKDYRGTLTEPGKNSPFRDRSVEENLKLFSEMKEGKHEKGEHLLRAKIDMSSGNINLRDPALYRIKIASHHKTGNTWCIYPMYDFCHAVSDSLEKITYSLCTLEFEDHRPLYNWVLEQLEIFPSRQIEFARLNLNYTVLSKRKLHELVETKEVNGWDDPRLPTLSGMRRRGYSSAAIKNFISSIGVAKANSQVDMAMLEHELREDLNKNSERRICVKDPIKLIIENYPEDKTEEVMAKNYPQDPDADSFRPLTFSKELYIERTDFLEDAPKKYFRLTPGKEVRLLHAYYVTCTGFKKNEADEVTEVSCTYDPETKGGVSEDGRKVKGTIHWLSSKTAKPAELRIYDRLFSEENPGAGGKDFKEDLNPDSLTVIENSLTEPLLTEAKPGEVYQFLRQGYFTRDLDDNSLPTFNQTVALRDSWKPKKV